MLSSSYPVPENEEQRLEALAEYNLIDTPPTEDFDRLVSLASRIFQVPIVLVSLVGRDRQFFKARVGLEVCETSREVSFCAYAIVEDEVLVVPDASTDARFQSNPLVLGPPHIRFYVGHKLTAPTGEVLGTVCLIDSVPRKNFSQVERENLADVAALIMDRMEIRRLNYNKNISQTRFENIAATSPDAIICTNSDGLITFWNKSAERLFGYSALEVEGKPSSTIIPSSWQSLYKTELTRLNSGQQLDPTDQTIELYGLHKDGTEFPTEFSLSTWNEGKEINVCAIVRDVTDRQLHEERLFKLASMDVLTELPNRSAWHNCLSDTLAKAIPSTVLLIDLDGFKGINDTLGHSAGDSVLKEVAARLRSLCCDAIISARLGGDEFVTLLHGDDILTAQAWAERLIIALSKPYTFAGKSIEIGASVGISLAPAHGNNAEDLLNACDLALYRAKTAGKGRVEFFTPVFREAQIAKHSLERELRLAFENGEFELFYQPQVNTNTQQVTGAEALLRWNHPTRGLLSPASFIDVLSQKPSAEEVGTWILRTACYQAAKWRSEIPDFRIGVNLFEAQMRSENLLNHVQMILNETGLPSEALELEIVENIILKNDKLTLKSLNRLRELGVGLAFDDYGTGFASLSLLKHYPLTRLKIDRSFVNDVTTDIEDVVVVKAILYLAENFGLDVIAEGVETIEQLDFLKINSCKEVQGYYFGKPVSANEFHKRFIM